MTHKFWRIFVFLFGVFLLGLPMMLIFQTIKESRQRDFDLRQQEAGKKNKSALLFFRTQDSFQASLEKRLNDAVFQITRNCVYQNNTASLAELRRSMSLVKEELINDGIVPECLLICRKNEKFDFPVAELPEISSHSAYLRFLGTLMLRDTFGEINDENYKAEIKRFEDGLLVYLGVSNTFGNVTGEFRKRILPVFIGNKPCYLLWSPLFNPNYVSFMREFFAKNPGKPSDRAVFLQDIMRKFLLGNVVIVIPRNLDESAKRKVLLNSFYDRDTQLALVLENNEFEFSKGFSPLVKNQLVKGKLPSKRFWVVGSQTIEIDSSFSLIAVTRLGKEAMEMKSRHSLISVFTVLGFFVGVCLLFCSVFIEIGVARSISGQLWSSFTLAPLLLLAVLFFCVQVLVEERHKLALQQNRLNLLQEMESIESRFILHRPGLRNEMEKISYSDRTLSQLREGQKRHDQGEAKTREFEEYFQNAFNRLFYPPFDMSLRRLTVSGVNGFYHAASRPNRAAQVDLFPRVIGSIFEQTLRELNPGLPGKGGTREGFYAEVALNHVREIFGGESLMNVLYGQDRMFAMTAGHGSWFINNYLLPHRKKAEFIISWTYVARYSDRNALRRILTQNDPYKIYAFETDQIGFFMLPQDGEEIPFLRTVARQVHASQQRVSLKIELKNQNYQIEGIPLTFGKQFVLVGLSPESPIEEKTRNLRFTLTLPLLGILILTFFLSWFASWDIIIPLNLLKYGMQMVGEGNFSHRLPKERNDELGDVCQAFNEMAKGLEEAEMMKKMISSAARNAVESEADEFLAQQGEILDVTVVFIGIPGFEDLSLALEPKELVEKMNVQTTLVCRKIHENAGEIDKLIGDKTLTFFSHKDLGPTAAVEAAVKAVLELATACEKDILPFPIAVGINTGQVIKGLLGSGDIRDFTIIGDPVNLAARAEAVAEGLSESKIVITENSLSHVEFALHTKQLSITQVKGKQKQVMLFQLFL